MVQSIGTPGSRRDPKDDRHEINRYWLMSSVGKMMTNDTGRIEACLTCVSRVPAYLGQ